jgi:ABC-2 type transport system ATP-binding protein
MTVVRPTRVEGTVLGQRVGDKATLARVGYLPENHRFPRYLTGRQTLEFFGAMAKVDRATARRRAGELLEIVSMKDWGDRKISTYSKGMMQRIGLAQALMNDPELVLLDEPTDGVDPLGRREIMDVMGRLREQGKTVFINSHALSELESICDRVAILVHGKVASQGTLEELTRGQERYEIELALPNPEVSRSDLLAMLRRMGIEMKEKIPAPKLPPPLGNVAQPLVARFAVDAGMTATGTWVELSGPWIRLGTAEPSAIQSILDELRRADFVIRRLTPLRQTLEDLFMQAVVDPVTGQLRLPGAALQGGRQ